MNIWRHGEVYPPMVWIGKSFPNSQIKKIQFTMKTELQKFYSETFLMGEMLYSFFKPGHPCYSVASFIAKNRPPAGVEVIPGLDYVSHSLMITESEAERQLTMMKRVIDDYITSIERQKTYEGNFTLEIPTVGSIFLSRSEKGKLISFRIDEPIVLNLGDQVMVNMFKEHFVNEMYTVSQRIKRISFSDSLYMYFLKPIEIKEEQG